MFEVKFPVIQSDVTKTVEPRYLLPRAPKSSWDGWFAIAIFPESSPMRWLKAHFFHRSCGEGMYPLSSVEALVESEVMIAWATADTVEVHSSSVDVNSVESTSRMLRVSFGDIFSLTGAAPDYRARYFIPDGGPAVDFRFEAGWPIWWSRFGRLFTYAGQHGQIAVTLGGDGSESSLEGFGVLEHVCGAAVPFDFTRRTPFHVHWDVLSFPTPGSPFDSAAGLSVGTKGETLFKIKAAAKLPGRSPMAMRGIDVKYLSVGETAGVDGQSIAVPESWEGSMNGPGGGRLKYRARAASPPAVILDGGGMLGFDFEGEWAEPGADVVEIAGAGFTEYMDFSGDLARLAERRG